MNTSSWTRLRPGPRAQPRRRAASTFPVASTLPAAGARTAAFALLAVTATSAGPLSAQADGSQDPVALLQARLDSGEVTLPFDTVTGWLPGILDALDIPVSSQGLVFSRTSLQTDRIAPWAPRALYFNDDVYIGYVLDGPIMEVTAMRPDGGAEFYSVNQTPDAGLRFQRETTTCLMCHESRSLTGGVPGLIVRSVLADRLGYPMGEVHDGQVTAATPADRRWGGWYITGQGAAAVHAANVVAPDLRHEVADVRQYVREFDVDGHRPDPTTPPRFDPEGYLSPHSDIVALTVLLHQAEVHNLISMAHESAREALREMGLLALVDIDEVVYEDLRPAGQTRVDGAVAALVDGLLFAREQPLPEPLRGESGFAEEFMRLGPFDAQGRSLRDLDMETRTFRYPLSFLIYTDAFERLPPLVKDRVYARLADVLAEDGLDDAYPHLTEADRRAIVEILADTKPDFPALPARPSPAG